MSASNHLPPWCRRCQELQATRWNLCPSCWNQTWDLDRVLILAFLWAFILGPVVLGLCAAGVGIILGPQFVDRLVTGWCGLVLLSWSVNPQW